MNGGTWIDAASAVGTFAAVAVALWIGIRDGRERDAERRDSEAGQARLVMVSSGTASGGGIWVVLTNHSSQPVTGLELDEVTWDGDEARGAPWRVPPTIMGARAATDILAAGDELKIPVEFLGPNGERIHVGVGSFTARYSFRDACGLTWSRIGNGEPRRVLRKVSRWPWRRRRLGR